MIIFKKVRWKNFLSTGNSFTEIELTRSTNTLIVGHNGAGKSTILDALTFGLFGKPYRKINKPQLINSINDGKCVVEIEFSIGKKEYKIVRGIKPNVFEIYCDGVLINQDAKATDYQEHLERFILKLNYKSFTQVVILGSASFVPFMQLSAADRRTIIEELLDIGIFSSMNTLVKGYISGIKDNQKDFDYKINLLNEKIQMQKQNIEEHKKNYEAEIEKRTTELNKNEAFVTKTLKDLELIQRHIDVLTNKIADEATVTSKNTKLVTLESKLEDNIRKINKEISFYETNDNCPTCQQAITEDTKEKHVSQKRTKIEEIEAAKVKLNEELDKVLTRIQEIGKIQKNISAHNSEVIRLNTQVKEVNKRTKALMAEIEELRKHTESSGDDNEKLKELNADLVAANLVASGLATEKQYYEFAATLLKDSGIKTKIVKQYLPVMNKLINKYLKAMDFFVNFNLNESFEETIKSRHRDEFSYASFSEGEKMRIDLALLFTWRQIAKMKNSTNTNLWYGRIYEVIEQPR